MTYSKELKNSIIIEMLPPNNQSITDIQRETGIPEGTLKKWRSELREKDLQRKESALAEESDCANTCR